MRTLLIVIMVLVITVAMLMMIMVVMIRRADAAGPGRRRPPHERHLRCHSRRSGTWLHHQLDREDPELLTCDQVNLSAATRAEQNQVGEREIPAA